MKQRSKFALTLLLSLLLAISATGCRISREQPELLPGNGAAEAEESVSLGEYSFVPEGTPTTPEESGGLLPEDWASLEEDYADFAQEGARGFFEEQAALVGKDVDELICNVELVRQFYVVNKSGSEDLRVIHIYTIAAYDIPGENAVGGVRAFLSVDAAMMLDGGTRSFGQPDYQILECSLSDARSQVRQTYEQDAAIYELTL